MRNCPTILYDAFFKNDWGKTIQMKAKLSNSLRLFMNIFNHYPQLPSFNFASWRIYPTGVRAFSSILYVNNVL